MKKTLMSIVPVLLLLVGWGAVSGFAEDEGPATESFELLLVDETRTFSSSVATGFENPLRSLEPKQQCDIILSIPRTIERDTGKQLWVVTRAFSEISPQLHAAVLQVKGIATAVFADVAEAVDVSEDLSPGFFAALFIKEGWL